MIIIIIIFIISLRRLMPQPAATARLSRTRWSKRISYGHRAPASPPHIPLSSARAQCRSSRFSHALVEALQRMTSGSSVAPPILLSSEGYPTGGAGTIC
ncbi:unnamed protein product [Prorocentrum cordatum]|uniref:Subtilisin n=1 Tax=Prorocentrum cordatum TaxID=2364126 RepID=A0ABN9YA38_9DINO|nr:unnamed protein product [Polarella glacialis]